MFLFFLLFVTQVLIGYTALYSSAGQMEETQDYVTMNIIYFMTSVVLIFLSYRKKQWKEMILYMALGIFVTIITILIMDV
ncbi:hypothetical protein [Salibacterium lacus]|uniref:DUF3953 domain-containing protein n=1 Tax=Salibacterium lacus TaxID=1898109 RepID=A0ABW5T5F9_9BACI